MLGRAADAGPIPAQVARAKATIKKPGRMPQSYYSERQQVVELAKALQRARRSYRRQTVEEVEKPLRCNHALVSVATDLAVLRKSVNSNGGSIIVWIDYQFDAAIRGSSGCGVVALPRIVGSLCHREQLLGRHPGPAAQQVEHG